MTQMRMIIILCTHVCEDLPMSGLDQCLVCVPWAPVVSSLYTGLHATYCASRSRRRMDLIDLRIRLHLKIHLAASGPGPQLGYPGACFRYSTLEQDEDYRHAGAYNAEIELSSTNYSQSSARSRTTHLSREGVCYSPQSIDWNIVPQGVISLKHFKTKNSVDYRHNESPWKCQQWDKPQKIRKTGCIQEPCEKDTVNTEFMLA